MNSNRITIIGLVGALIAVIGVAGLMFNETEADITNESKAEMFNFMADTYVSQSDHEDDLEEIEDAIAHPHIDLAKIPPMSLAIQTIRNDIQMLKNDIASIERDLDDDRPTSSSNDFDLITALDSRGDNEEDRFEPGEIVYILGENDSSERSLDWEIRDPDNDRIYSRSPGISQHGDFILSWNIPDDAEDGRYTIIVEIDREEDQIDFIVN